MSYVDYCFGEKHIHDEYMDVKDGFITIEDNKWLSDYTDRKYYIDVVFDTINPDHVLTHNHIYVVSDELFTYNEILDTEKRIWYKFHQMFPNLIGA